MGVDKQGTTRIRRVTKETQNSTGYSPLQPCGTNQNRDRRIEIRLFRYPVTTVQRRGMEASCLPIKDDARRRMHYDIHDKELLAIVQVFKEWKRDTRGSPRPIQVFTDHKNLVTFMTTKELSHRQGRWREFLSQYNFRIIYRPGKEGKKPDALTRRPGDVPTAEEKRLGKRLGILLPRETCWDIPGDEDIKIEEMELAEFQDKDEGRIRQAYNKDEELQTIKNNLAKGVKKMKGVALGLCEWKDEHL